MTQSSLAILIALAAGTYLALRMLGASRGAQPCASGCGSCARACPAKRLQDAARKA